MVSVKTHKTLSLTHQAKKKKKKKRCLIIIKDIEFIIKNLPGPGDFTGQLYQTLQEEVIPILHKTPLENRERGAVSQLAEAASIDPSTNPNISLNTQAAGQSKNASRPGDAHSCQF